jgi:hypothetical protein
VIVGVFPCVYDFGRDFRAFCRSIGQKADADLVHELNLGMTQEKVKLGKVTQNIIDLLELPYEEKDIMLWKDRIKYLEKHRSYFPSEEAFIKHSFLST